MVEPLTEVEQRPACGQENIVVSRQCSCLTRPSDRKRVRVLHTVEKSRVKYFLILLRLSTNASLFCTIEMDQRRVDALKSYREVWPPV